MKSRDVVVPSSAVLGLLLAFTPSRADACGGTFCDNGNPMPVDQTGEDILFIQDGDQIETHVRIQYLGEAERFAWMVPLASIPEVSIGSEPLFVEVARTTIPFWTTSRSFENPADIPPPSTTAQGFTPSSDSGDEPEVVLEEVVGAFEVVVLAGGTAAEVLEFFTQNDYLFEPEAEPIIQAYLDEGFLITGIKLTGGAGVEAIHPIVFRSTTDEPCVPIRLTAVAAAEDLGIRAYFLGQDRWAPSNYDHVVPNASNYDWDTQSYASYVDMVTRAVDEAGGHAFVTDYAGPSDVVNTAPIWQPSFTADGFELMSPYEAIVALDERLFLSGANGIPVQLRLLLRKYLPAPPDIFAEDDFWIFYQEFAEYYADMPTWDGAAFAAELDELVIVPGMHAVDMLEAWPYLTRLHTTISPHEMTVDPTFHPNGDLPNVVNTRQADSLVLDGGFYARYDIPLDLDQDGETSASTRLCVIDESNWPTGPLAMVGMPAALRIETIPQMGPPQVMVDNQEAIASAAEAYNLSTTCNADGGDEGGESGTGGESGDGGGTGGGINDGDASGSACACSSGPDDGGPLAWGVGLLGLVGLGLTRRHRRNRD